MDAFPFALAFDGAHRSLCLLLRALYGTLFSDIFSSSELLHFSGCTDAIVCMVLWQVWGHVLLCEHRCFANYTDDFFTKQFFWSPMLLFSLLGTVVVLFLEGCTMVSLRGLWIAAEAANLEAERVRKQLNEAYEQQKQLNQLKNQFILNVNHELRTPLTAAYGYLELMQVLLDEQGYLERTTHGRYLKYALNYCDELRSLVNNVLDIMAIGSEKGQLELETLDVRKVVADILEHFYMQWQFKHRVQLKIVESLQVYANIQCLRHVLYNLLSNAFKYSPGESLVVIEAVFDATSGQVRVGIKDEGPGIPASEIPLLFGQFVRLQRDLAGAVRGTGLGLYISKYLVDVMRGRIWVESSGVPGQGSCFYFTLPAAP